MLKPCPCGSGREFMKCCKPFITGKALPQTAEQLMRSRYTAYTRANIDYIKATQQHPHFDTAEAKRWAEQSKWLGLKVLNATLGGENDNTGTVEFIATYKLNGQRQELHEVSQFQKIEGKWIYLAPGATATP